MRHPGSSSSQWSLRGFLLLRVVLVHRLQFEQFGRDELRLHRRCQKFSHRNNSPIPAIRALVHRPAVTVQPQRRKGVDLLIMTQLRFMRAVDACNGHGLVGLLRVLRQRLPRRRQLAAEGAPRRPELDEGVLLRREVGVPGVASALDVVDVDAVLVQLVEGMVVVYALCPV